MIDLISVEQVLCVAEYQSFRRAAEVLGMRQSAVSRRIAALESELGISLFERHSSGVRLTRAGSAFLTRARSSLDDLASAKQESRHLAQGCDGLLRLGIGCSLAGGPIRRIITAFRSAYPATLIQLIEDGPHENMARICDGRLDLSFALGRSKVTDLEQLIIGTERFFVAVSADHAFAERDAADRLAVEREHVLVRYRSTHIDPYLSSSELSDRTGASQAIERHRVDRETLFQMVAMGFGIAVATESAVAGTYPGVVFVPLAPPDNVVDLSAVWSNRNVNPALRKLVEMARLEAA